uniref:Uncharacterized protein n=1 Tax=Salix viminalis TaxID=40686 RepID=A0A6N2L9M0_SALVM
MVCQAASQTRFRALKHENGSAGKPTIIVRVIAYYQPLQDCQFLCSIKLEFVVFLFFSCSRRSRINSTLQIKHSFGM